jgi:HAMP domain-containing protein
VSESNEKSSRVRSGSVVRRFNLALFLIYLCAIAVAAPSIYYVTRGQVHAQAERELSALVDMVKSIQGFVAKDLRPFLLQHELFYAPGFSGIVATSHIAENFKQFQPEYYIKNASDNPLNPANVPQPLEMELLNRFRDDRELSQWTQTGDLNGKRMLISSAPKISKQGCLRCHGSREKAPEEIRTRFTGELGYGYKTDEVVGVSVVGVPMENVHELSLQRTGIVLALLTLLFAVVLVTVNLMVRKSLLRPILEITAAAHALSRGSLDKQVTLDRNDEIGDLARSVELVRRSFHKLMQRMRKR